MVIKNYADLRPAIRTVPMHLDGDISGDSSSDDENDVAVGYLSYLERSNDKGKKGYLLKEE